MISIKIDEDVLVEMLVERVKYWKEDEDVIELYRTYYEDLANSGCFDGYELDVMQIVDNDVVNWLDVITEEDFKNYNIEDEEDENIVASYKDLYLIRTC